MRYFLYVTIILRGKMKESLKFLLSFWLVVITDPYSSINYEEPQVYEFKRQFRKLDIKVYCAEGHDDCHNLTEHQEEKVGETEEESRQSESYFCYICNPPQWIHF